MHRKFCLWKYQRDKRKIRAVEENIEKVEEMKHQERRRRSMGKRRRREKGQSRERTSSIKRIITRF